MTTISLFTPINYARPRSYSEGALSTLSNYFYLGGNRAKVIRNDEVRLEPGKISWYTIALKVASYVLLCPLTLTLLAINLVLRSQHHFTVIIPSKKSSQSPVPVIPEREAPTAISPTILATEHTQTNIPPSSQESQRLPPVPPQERELPITHPSAATITVQPIERVRQEVIPISRPTETFQSFTIKISDKTLPVISSLEEMRLKACEVAQQVSDRHIKIRINIPSYYGLERTQAMKFIEELKNIVDVIPTRWTDLFYIVPKKTEEIQENFTILRYNNGVIEKVESSRESEDGTWWQGRRIYPNGVIEIGRFDDFEWHSGTCVEKEVTTYRFPKTLVSSYELDRSLIYTDIEGEKQLIVIHKKPDAGRWDYVQVNEELIPTLAKILQMKQHANISHDIKKDMLREILSGPINCEEFFKFLFETNAIFSLNPYSLGILLSIIKEKKLAINLRQQHPETKETLLDRYSGNVRILKALLTIDPTLIQRTEGIEIAFVRALLTGNKQGASLLFTSMEEQKIPLLPRELFFKKVALSEGEVTLEELQTFSLEDQEIIYKLANIHSQLNVVRIMRTLGFSRSNELMMREGPSIFGCNMDALEMHEQLQSFLKHLRSQKLLLTESEFDQLPVGNYIEKGGDIGRILGRDYIERKARELGLNHIKVPKKMIVIDDETNLKLRTGPSLDIEVLSGNITVYAKRIQASSRRITSEEVSELFSLFESTGFSDIHWGNIIIAEDGVYIIDTEFTNFWIARFYFEQGRQYAEMEKIVHALPVEQQPALIDVLNTKIATYQEHEEELNEQRMLRFQAERAALQKSGCFYSPSFTFAINEIITQVLG